MDTRTILHSDANCFYASVEMLLNPELRGKPVAVCGSTEERHGIVLAKSELAKRAGVKTGMANWEARQACPGLIVVSPQYDQYCKFSKLLRNIYLRYTDLVEPYGMKSTKIPGKNSSDPTKNAPRKKRFLITRGRAFFRAAPGPKTFPLCFAEVPRAAQFRTLLRRSPSGTVDFPALLGRSP